MPDPTHVYVSKYALSGKIERKEVKSTYVHDDGYVSLKTSDGQRMSLGRDCYETLDEAVAAAEDARTKKITSLRKQIERLEKRNFRKDIAE